MRLSQPDRAILDVARSVKGFLPEDEALALYRAALDAAGRVRGPLLEVGTYCGKSALYLGAAARRAHTVAVSVDHHRGSEETQPGWEHFDPEVLDPTSGRVDTLPFARRSLAAAGMEDCVILVVGESGTVAALWDRPLALLFIDGGHGEQVAWADYEGWSPKVAAGGTLAIHDVFADPAEGGRPPYEIYLDACRSGRWDDDPAAACGSLRVLHRRGVAA